MNHSAVPSEDGGELLFDALNADAGLYVRGGRLIERGVTPYQRYEVWDSPQFGRLYRLDDAFMASEADEFLYHENLVHLPCIAQTEPRRALILGGGDGGSAKELLRHASIERIVLVELDEKVLEIARRHLPAVHGGALDDPRVEVRIGDALRYVHEAGRGDDERFDLIVFDLTDPVGHAASLFSGAFFAACKVLLNEQGAVSLHLGAPFFQTTRVRDVLAGLRNTFRHVLPYFLPIPLYGALWGMACASDLLNPARLSAREIDQRLAERGIGPLRYYNGATHHAQRTMPPYLQSLLG